MSSDARERAIALRTAALTHAGIAQQRASGEPQLAVFGELASAIACGLVYIGDLIAALTDALGGKP